MTFQKTALTALFLIMSANVFGQAPLVFNKELISYDYKFLREQTEKESEGYLNNNFKVSPVISQKGDTLLVYIEFPGAGCASYKGSIKIKEDSLDLFYWVNSDVTCTELDYYAITYAIMNKEKRKYRISFKYLENQD
ncbi:hypothetical protein C3K47_11130 [Solitalea longa]|uniref:Uncharacterized protein n=1 Tax=Solitalea longa TaxID=2079460 RepID=A0A2S5A135_9SPHI|nr:hypothetical protein [Solitalea longa]POY36300.1 hypothetical protein C3K47_11130 [Solitalea longa]